MASVPSANPVTPNDSGSDIQGRECGRKHRGKDDANRAGHRGNPEGFRSKGRSGATTNGHRKLVEQNRAGRVQPRRDFKSYLSGAAKAMSPFSKFGFQRGLDTAVEILSLMCCMVFCTLYLGHVIITNGASSRANSLRIYDAIVNQQKMDLERSRELSLRLESVEDRLKLLSEKLENDSVATQELKERVEEHKATKLHQNP